MNDYGPVSGEDIVATGSRGLLVLCEGNFMYGNSTMSYYDMEARKVENEVFYRRNGIPLGDVAQSVCQNDGTGYVVVNNSGVIHVIDLHTFERKGFIKGLGSPRYMHFLDDGRAYLSDLYAGKIFILDPLSGNIEGSIDLTDGSGGSHNAEQMVSASGKIFSNSWAYDNVILVIDPMQDSVLDMIEVGKQPSSIITDKYDRLWVLCDGGYEGSPYGCEDPSIWLIDTETHKIIYRRVLDGAESSVESGASLPGAQRGYLSASGFVSNGARDTIYYISGDVWRFAADNYESPEIFLKRSENLFYALAVDPETSEVYVSDAIDFVQKAAVMRFTPSASPVDTFKVGVTPGAFLFLSNENN